MNRSKIFKVHTPWDVPGGIATATVLWLCAHLILVPAGRARSGLASRRAYTWGTGFFHDHECRSSFRWRACGRLDSGAVQI